MTEEQIRVIKEKAEELKKFINEFCAMTDKQINYLCFEIYPLEIKIKVGELEIEKYCKGMTTVPLIMYEI